MAQLLGLSAEQVDRIRPLFSKECGVKRVDDRKVLSGIIPVIQKGLRWVDAPGRRPPQNPLQPLPSLVRQGCFDLIFSELSASDSAEPPDAAEPEVLMLDATDVKACPTACSLNKGGAPA